MWNGIDLPSCLVGQIVEGDRVLKRGPTCDRFGSGERTESPAGGVTREVSLRSFINTAADIAVYIQYRLLLYVL